MLIYQNCQQQQKAHPIIHSPHENRLSKLQFFQNTNTRRIMFAVFVRVLLFCVNNSKEKKTCQKQSQINKEFSTRSTIWQLNRIRSMVESVETISR